VGAVVVAHEAVMVWQRRNRLWKKFHNRSKARDHYDREAKARQGMRTDLKPNLQEKIPEGGHKQARDANDREAKARQGAAVVTGNKTRHGQAPVPEKIPGLGKGTDARDANDREAKARQISGLKRGAQLPVQEKIPERSTTARGAGAAVTRRQDSPGPASGKNSGS
jgi:hypothetical protein